VQVEVDGGLLKASHVIFAGPPWAAASLFGQSMQELAAPLHRVRGFATATVFFALNEVDIQQDLQGSGFIVPPGEAEILAGTFVSSKWDGRAPAGKALIRAFIGGARQDIRCKTDGELRSIAHRELTRLLGPLGPVLFSRVHVYERGTPQPEMGHLELLREVEGALQQLPWLSLVGSGYDGVGIPDCIRQAEDAAALLS
jgi:oxygen-dependent protoporphyrinogen oxidase